MAGNDPVDTKKSSRLRDTLHRANPLHGRRLSLFPKPKTPELRVIYIIGGPSSGKTSIATMLAQEYPMRHLIPSEVISQVQKAGSEDDKQFIKDKMSPDTGKLPDDALCTLLRKVMQQSIQNGERCFIIEGVPATIGQFKCFAKEFGHEMIIYVKISGDEMEKRHMAPEMNFVEGEQRKADLDARRNDFFTNLALMGNDPSFPLLQHVDGEKSLAEIITALRHIMNGILKIKERTKGETSR